MLCVNILTTKRYINLIIKLKSKIQLSKYNYVLHVPGELVVSIGTQLLSVSGTHPSLQEQIIVRKGTVSTTEQMAVEAQGLNSKQGF
jgi:hypothetical protein